MANPRQRRKVKAKSAVVRQSRRQQQNLRKRKGEDDRNFAKKVLANS